MHNLMHNLPSESPVNGSNRMGEKTTVNGDLISANAKRTIRTHCTFLRLVFSI